VKLVHLVGFIAKEFVTMHGHMNVKLGYVILLCYTDVLLHVWTNKWSPPRC